MKFIESIKVILLFCISISIRTVLTETNVVLVSTSQGEIGAGNYSHYFIKERGNYKLVLISTTGDCDIYATDKHRLVNFDNYDWKSNTYGEDEIYITDQMKRPVSIGVYAHPYYLKSTYVLNKYKIITNKPREVNGYSNTDLFFEDLSESDGHRESSQHNIHAEHNNQDDNNESFFWKLFFHLLEIIAEVIL